MRISRGNEVLGRWPPAEIRKRIANATLFSTDLFYDEESSEWAPLADFLAAKATPPPAVKLIGRPCYCGSGLSFPVCHGDSTEY